jgi:hypothetical protein
MRAQAVRGAVATTGEFPYHMALVSHGNTRAAIEAYAASQRNNEVMRVHLRCQRDPGRRPADAHAARAR